MTNLAQNDKGNFTAICPYCNSKIIFQFQIVDLFIYTDFDGEHKSITLKKTLTSKKPENEEYMKNLIINSLKRKPFFSRIIITRPYHETINELTKTGFLNNQDLENINDNY